MPNTTVPFTWKIIWRSNVPPRVAFFSWTSTVEKVLTIGNLWKRCIVVIDWCYMCKDSGETVYHLLLNCGVRNLVVWSSMGYALDFFSSWQSRFCGVWYLVCLEFNGLCYKEFWIYFNARSFEGRERTILDLKKLLFFSFFWSLCLIGFHLWITFLLHLFQLSDFIYHCNLRVWWRWSNSLLLVYLGLVY